MRFSLFAATTTLVGSAIAAEHFIAVGNGSLTFEPANLTAAEGDTVTFKFWPKSHSVAQAAFASPCEPLEDGFWSGFIPSQQGAAETTFSINITNASQPLWYYCSRAEHCQNGMVGVINPPNNRQRTLAAFTEAAANATNNTSPVTTAGTGGWLSNGTSTNGTTDTGAASTLVVSNSVILTAGLGMFAFLLL